MSINAILFSRIFLKLLFGFINGVWNGKCFLIVLNRFSDFHESQRIVKYIFLLINIRSIPFKNGRGDKIFKAPIYQMPFLRPLYKKWHFKDRLIQNMAFSKPSFTQKWLFWDHPYNTISDLTSKTKFSIILTPGTKMS